MIGKLPVLGFAIVTALSGTALANENCDPPRPTAAPVGYGGYRTAPPVTRVDYGRAQLDLRYADQNRDGRVTLNEAMDSGRQTFRRTDRDNNWVLTRYEMGRGDVRRDDRNNDGRVTVNEYQRAVRARFASLDTNRDGVLGRRELGFAQAGPNRSAGWWTHR